jgi:zinc transport system permease protein
MIQDFLQYDFLRNSLYAAVLIGLVAPLLGVFIVIRRLSLIADALSHVTLSGIAASLHLEKTLFPGGFINPLYMGMVFSIGGALFNEKLRAVYKHNQ